MINQDSYSSASILPAKLLRAKDLCIALDNNIIPVHFQLCPTNKCNLNCSFCSCSKREKKQELNLNDIQEMICNFYTLGARAVTITGGGEPCCHSNLDEIITQLSIYGIKVGLVSNGILLPTIQSVLNKITWCRISVSDARDVDQLLGILKPIIKGTLVDWAFSYVVTKEFNIEKFIKVVKFANKNNFTHVRLVSDLLDLKNLPSMQDIKQHLLDSRINDSLVIYQDRQWYTKGVKQCWISLLKPVIAPDGYLYPCCGVQYALDNSIGLFPKEMRMCHISELKEFYRHQKPFNGSICSKCYYEGYNIVLDKMVKHYNHSEFI